MSHDETSDWHLDETKSFSLCSLCLSELKTKESLLVELLLDAHGHYVVQIIYICIYSQQLMHGRP